MHHPPDLPHALLVAAEELEEVVEQPGEGVPVDRSLPREPQPLVVAEGLHESVPGDLRRGTHLEEPANGPRVHIHGRVL